jgi:hypothetical protein
MRTLRDAILVLGIAAIGTTVQVRVDRPSTAGTARAAERPAAAETVPTERLHDVAIRAAEREARAEELRLLRLEQRGRATARERVVAPPAPADAVVSPDLSGVISAVQG